MKNIEIADNLKHGIVSKLNLDLQAKIESIPLEYWDMDRDEVEFRLSNTGLGGSTVDRLRYRFWKLASESTGYDGPISTREITRGICTQGNWYRIIKDPLKLRWILEPVIEVIDGMSMILETNFTATINKIMKLPDDPKSLRFKFEVLEKLNSRVHGTPTQTINQKSLNVSLKGNVSEAEKIAIQLREIEEQHAELNDPFIIK